MSGTDTAASPTLASRELRSILMGAAVTRACQLAGELGIADALAAGPLRVEELALRLDLHAPSLLRLLRLLAAHDIFAETTPAGFGNTRLSDCLRGDHPESLRGLACALAGNDMWRAWEGLESTVRRGGAAFHHVHGKHLFEYLAAHPDSERRFAGAMASSSRVLNQSLASAYPWRQHGCIADIGGGTGTTLLHLLRNTPGARGLLFDVPSVIVQARETLAASGLAARCDLAGGSFFEQVPAGADACLLKLVLHDWGDEECVRILRNCHAALGARGRLLICERLLGGEPTARYANVTDLVMLALTRQGRERSCEAYATLLARGGFALRKVWPVDGEMYLLEAACKAGSFSAP